MWETGPYNNLHMKYATVAQSVERLSEEQEVDRSKLSHCTTLFPGAPQAGGLPVKELHVSSSLTLGANTRSQLGLRGATGWHHLAVTQEPQAFQVRLLSNPPPPGAITQRESTCVASRLLGVQVSLVPPIHV